jgi:glycosyltransferase involved in cell wall biosynthesis
MKTAAGAAADRLVIYGVGHYVPREVIDACYHGFNWLAGLAIFPPTEHYLKKELTKFFEYMLVELPILCSNFPVWQAVVQDNGYGLVVDPYSEEQITLAIKYMEKHSAEAALMGRCGRDAVLKHYNWRSQEHNLLDLCEEIIRGD